MNTKQALHELGVHEDTLSAREKEQLDRDGFLLLPDILSGEQIAKMQTLISELVEKAGDEATSSEPGVERLYALYNQDPIFDIGFTHPRVLAAVHHVLGEIKLRMCAYRAALPGAGLQGMHCDAPPAPGRKYTVCNTFWLLADFTPENGATRIVAGSHRSGALPQMADPLAPHPDEMQLLAPAGTVVIFNSHLWHGGMTNATSQKRPAISYWYAQRDFPPHESAPLTRETYERLSPAARTILGASPVE